MQDVAMHLIRLHEWTPLQLAGLFALVVTLSMLAVDALYLMAGVRRRRRKRRAFSETDCHSEAGIW
jgi:hypothetical protein